MSVSPYEYTYFNATTYFTTLLQLIINKMIVIESSRNQYAKQKTEDLLAQDQINTRVVTRTVVTVVVSQYY
jgi:hypothetical protein